MAKTIFVDGSILTPTFMDASFGNSAITGHRHTGQNDDGSQPQVQCATDLDPVNGKTIHRVNLIVSGTEDVEFSFDGGSTYPITGITFQYQRIGTFVFGRVRTTVNQAATVSSAQMRPTGAGTWDPDFLGTDTFDSVPFHVRTNGGVETSTRMNYFGVSSDVQFAATASFGTNFVLDQDQQIVWNLDLN